MSTEANYIGNELELFAHANNWKHYWGRKVSPYIGEIVLEVGAGIGTNTKFLLALNPHVKEWICVEPDQRLASQIKSAVSVEHKVKIENVYLKDLKADIKFDTILYIDVIEHLENDKNEIDYAKSLLNENGYLIVLVPAHNYLFSDFDKAIGHYRRYNKKMLKAAAGIDLIEEKLMYLDSVGMFASIMNKLFLKQSYPSIKQINFWDNYMINTSKIFDKVTFNKMGKSLLGVWRNKK